MGNLSVPTRLTLLHGAISTFIIFTFTVAMFAEYNGLLPDFYPTLASTFVGSKQPQARLVRDEAASNRTGGGADIIINEVDSDTPGADNAEFVELYDGGVGNTPLDGYVVVLYNGSTDLSYRALDLDGFSTNANGYFTLGNAAVSGVDIIFPNDGLQNGQDAVALYSANATNFPTGTAVTTTNIVDALVYDNGQADDAGLLVLLNAMQPQINENGSTTGQTVSMQRCPNGSGGDRNTNTYAVFTPTPDGDNMCSLLITLSASSYLDDESQSMVITVARTTSGSSMSSVELTTGGGNATGGTCSGGADYESQNVTVTFTGLDTTETVNIQLCADLLKELSETFNITLSNPSNATLGSPSAAVATINDTATQFTNTAAIIINESGAATPYPSTINVAGAPGSIYYMRVTLFDVAADRADDLDVLLVGPGGQSIVLMADAGGAGAVTAGPTITFNDNGTPFLPDATAIASGSYKPSSWENGPAFFPAPAPIGPHAEPGPGGVARSAFLNTVFGATNGNGIWSLYVLDDTAGPLAPLAPGSIAGGWGLEMLAPTAAALSLSGRVTDASGMGIRNAIMTLEGGGLTEPRYAATGSLGYYSFDGLSNGTYFLTVNAKRHTFVVPSRAVTMTDDVTNADFVADPRE